jgi:hypothetical protein
MYEVRESRPDVGSSKNKTCGSEINSNAIEVRFLYPPEIPFTIGPPTSDLNTFKVLTPLLVEG